MKCNLQKKGNRIKKKEADTIQKRSLHGILPSIFPNMKPPQKKCEWKAYGEDGKAKASIVLRDGYVKS